MLLAVLATTLGTALASVASPAAAVTISPDVPSLPEGSAPAVPYLDVPGDKIVDGGRTVDVTGLQGRVIQLYKVDGGYLLGRSTTVGPQLVFASTAGKRTLITKQWYARTATASPTSRWSTRVAAP